MKTELVRELFENVTLPSFGGDDGCEFNYETGDRKWLRKPNGEYVSGDVEDHWNTFQEGFEEAIKQCVKIAYQNDVAKFTKDGYTMGLEIQKHFGVEYSEKNHYLSHALQEFRAANWVDNNGKYINEMQEAICNHVLQLLEVFREEGHSGSSAPYAVNLFSKLALFDPIVPLTGEDWEWDCVADGLYQNKRLRSVFKDCNRFDGQAYWMDGKVFWEWYQNEDGEMRKTHFSNRKSFTPITFPWIKPKESEYIFSPTEEFPNEVL